MWNSNIRTWNTRDSTLKSIESRPPQSSSSGKGSPSSSEAADTRQVKSLTPDRERRLAAKAAPALRKASSTKGLKAANGNDENSSGGANVRGGANRGAKTAKGRGQVGGGLLRYLI